MHISTAIVSALGASATYVLVGMFGSLLESIGLAASAPRLVRVGKAIEAAAADVPKFLAQFKGAK